MQTLTISEDTLACLQARAASDGTTVDDLVRQLLDSPPPAEALLARAILKHSTDIISLFDLDFRHLYVNSQIEAVMGVKPADMVGKSNRELGQPDDVVAYWEATFQEVVATGQEKVLYFDYPALDGIRSYESRLSPILNADGEVSHLLSIARDITERRIAEETLKEERNLFIGGSTVIFKWMTEPGWPVSYVSPNVTEQFGYQADEFISGGLLFAAIVHPDDIERMSREAAAHSNSGKVQFEQEYRIRRTDGEFRWVTDSTVVVRDAHGVPKYFHGYVHDITDRKQAEQARLEQERLKASLKKEQELNSTIQRAVSALAHDMRTPLSVISSAKELMLRYFDRMDETKRREKLDSIDKQLRYVLDLLDDMSLLVKGSLSERQFQPAPTHLATLCQMSLNEIKETIGTGHTMIFATDGQIGTVTVDETLVSRILLNLLTNAVKFSPAGSEIKLGLYLQDNRIVLRVIDHGMGVADEDLKHIFEPFYRAETVGEISGTGLGLNIVRDCVEQHSGRISAESQPGKGTTFTVWLPMSGNMIPS